MGCKGKQVKSNSQYRLWYKRRLRKLEKHRLRRKYKSPSSFPYRDYQHSKPSPREFTLTPPANFSFLCNRDETCRFFARALRKICHSGADIEVYFDLRNINKITSDAIMYLLAVIMNAKHSQGYKASFQGNCPNDEACNHALEQVGFFNYVYKRGTSDVRPLKKSPYIIKTGNDVNSLIAKELCEHTNLNSKYDRKMTRPLYSVIGELMTNVVQHAYDEQDSDMISKWYICVEENAEEIRFVFLDTGEGIPTTAQKKWPEKLLGGLLADEGRIIKSAFMGEFRTRTNKDNRGKGLPSIYENCQNGILDHVSVLSGYGCCKISSTKGFEIEAQIMESKFTGTLFTWLIKKEGVRDDSYQDCN